MRYSTFVLYLAALLLAACGARPPQAPSAAAAHAHPPGTGAHTHGEIASAGQGNVKPVLATSELLPGPNRFVFGLVNARTGAPIKDAAKVDVQFFRVNADETATKVGDAAAVYRGEGLPVGVFVSRARFDRAGEWGAILTVHAQGVQPFAIQMDFDVAADSPVPAVGEPAPPSRSLTAKDVQSPAEIDSAVPPSGMYDVSISDAVRSGKPALLLFATPGFCETATCGPDLEVAKALRAKYGERAHFIHIETPTSEAAPQAQKPTVREWGLTSEPWIFLVDRQGTVAERFEGGLTLAEVEPAFEQLLR